TQQGSPPSSPRFGFRDAGRLVWKFSPFFCGIAERYRHSFQNRDLLASQSRAHLAQILCGQKSDLLSVF
ncbi:MAG: hypothetical protein ABJL57_18390, partial [Hyphomonas sp.]|uniref:hypothetical protein n=1 Tax=Hyphomonas sp. TaxID=87 RepID=UPI003298865D